jgi:hypothetical protein
MRTLLGYSEGPNEDPLIQLRQGPIAAYLGGRGPLSNGSKTSYTFSKTTKHAKGTNRQGPL